MNGFKDIVITDILRVNVIPATKGRSVNIVNRPSYALSFSEGEGVIEYKLGGTSVISDSTHAVLLPKGGTYSLGNLEGGNFPIINFETKEPFSDKIHSLKISNPERYLKDYDYLQRLHTLGDNRHAELSVLYGIFARLSRESVSRHPILSPAMDYIADNIYRTGLTNGTLAKISGVSEIYFRRTFKEHYGTTPAQYILKQKFEHAKELLREGGSTVGAVSEACGFTSVYHFSRIFKLTVGVTPTEYCRTEREKV